MYTWKKSFGAAFAGLALALAFTAQPAQGSIITYSSQAVFDAAFPGLTQQDFSAAKVADGNFGLMANPLDSSTNNAIFSPGDIKDGLRITVGVTEGTSIPAGGVLASAYTLDNRTQDAFAFVGQRQSATVVPQEILPVVVRP